MKRVAYFGTEGCAGHYFRAIAGNFTREEEKEIERIDGDAIYKVFDSKYCFAFFMWGNYGCLGFPASPDDSRGGCKTVVFVEGETTKVGVLEAVNASPFVKSQFEKLAKIYKVEIPSIQPITDKP